MLIGLTGSLKSGKSTLVNILVKDYQFKELIYQSNNSNNNNKIEEDKKHFSDIELLNSYVTNQWEFNYVIEIGNQIELINIFRKRPFFLLIHIDAPIEIRFLRWLKDQSSNLFNNDNNNELLYKFIKESDKNTYPAKTTLINNDVSDIHINNPFNTILELTQQIITLDLLNKNHLRPNWDLYFMHLAQLASRRSNCMKRRVGCLIVKDFRVIATGYNGTPRGVLNCNEGGCNRCNRNSKGGMNLDECLCIHAEENALLEAGRERIQNGKAVLYCVACPCLGCAKKVIQVGIKEVVYAEEYSHDELTKTLFHQAGVKLRKFESTTLKLIGYK